MKKIFVMVCIGVSIFLTLNCDDNSIDPKELAKNVESSDYYPLKVGNKWVYYKTHTLGEYIDLKPSDSIQMPLRYLVKREITKETIIDNKKYFWFKETLYGIDISLFKYSSPYFRSEGCWETYDVNTGYNVYLYSSNNKLIESQYDKISLSPGERVESASSLKECLSEEHEKHFGDSLMVKNIHYWSGYDEYSVSYAKSWGMLTYSYKDEFLSSINMTLKGAIVNSKVLGDTTIENSFIISCSRLRIKNYDGQATGRPAYVGNKLRRTGFKR